PGGAAPGVLAVLWRGGCAVAVVRAPPRAWPLAPGSVCPAGGVRGAAGGAAGFSGPGVLAFAPGEFLHGALAQPVPRATGPRRGIVAGDTAPGGAVLGSGGLAAGWPGGGAGMGRGPGRTLCLAAGQCPGALVRRRARRRRRAAAVARRPGAPGAGGGAP